MKVSIPLESTLSTDSHKNDIKNPAVDRDLFNVNRSYLFNKHLTNAKKTTVPPGDYITTQGDLLSVIPGSEKTQIYHNGQVIADVLSLGVEDISFLDKDDAVIDEGSLWAVQKTLSGYTLEQTNLQTMEVTTSTIEQNGILDVRLIRNTHKVIARNMDGSVTIDEVIYSDENMRQYLTSFSGEFIAAEINGKIYFGYNNPAGVEQGQPQFTLNIPITGTGIKYNWRLIDAMNDLGADQNLGYIININVSTNVSIGSNSNSQYAMDLFTGITKPSLHTINLNLETGSLITGKGGAGASSYSGANYSLAENGGSAIRCGSNLNITGGGRIQAGGGGGGAGIIRMNPGFNPPVHNNYGGSGGAGMALGAAGSGKDGNGNIGQPLYGGAATTYSGKGGDPGEWGSDGYSNLDPEAISLLEELKGAAPGHAIRMINPAILDISNEVNVVGGISNI